MKLQTKQNESVTNPHIKSIKGLKKLTGTGDFFPWIKAPEA
jgi:hypothetical protein